jgi:hypothetical protein
MIAPLAIFRVIAPEFSTVDDATVNAWLDLTAPLVSRKRFGKMYEQSLALLTAHRIKTVNAGSEDTASDGLDSIGGVGAAFKVASYSSGGESVSFYNGALSQKLSSDAEFSQTVYGVQYLTLRDLHTISIISAGERG